MLVIATFMLYVVFVVITSSGIRSILTTYLFTRVTLIVENLKHTHGHTNSRMEYLQYVYGS